MKSEWSFKSLAEILKQLDAEEMKHVSNFLGNMEQFERRNGLAKALQRGEITQQEYDAAITKLRFKLERHFWVVREVTGSTK